MYSTAVACDQTFYHRGISTSSLDHRTSLSLLSIHEKRSDSFSSAARQSKHTGLAFVSALTDSIKASPHRNVQCRSVGLIYLYTALTSGCSMKIACPAFPLDQGSGTIAHDIQNVRLAPTDYNELVNQLC